ncbi:MAG: maleylpyruvate isomerase N-terminal domain-containing protein [Nocardioidaceae bacterium]
MTVTPDHVRQAAAATRRALEPVVDADWSIPARDLEWSVWDTGVHIADDQVFYATQLIAQPGDHQGYTPFELTMWAKGARNEGMIRAIQVCAEILARVVATAGPDDRGYHVYGVSDAEGFAAMGIVETLVHTYDMAVGLGVDWRPPGDVSIVVLERLFLEAPVGDPSQVLLWCTGREPLGDLPRRAEWRWDGTSAPDAPDSSDQSRRGVHALGRTNRKGGSGQGGELAQRQGA